MKTMKDYLRFGTKVALTSALALSMFGLTGCSSGGDTETDSSTDNTAETTTDDGTIDYDTVYANLPTATEPETDEIDEEAKQLYTNAYNKLLDLGYFIEKADQYYSEVYYDSSTSNLYGVSINLSLNNVVLVQSANLDKYSLYAIGDYVDDEFTYTKSIYENDENNTFSISDYIIVHSIYDLISNNENPINVSYETNSRYKIIHIKYFSSFGYNVYLYNDTIIQVDYLKYTDSDYEISKTYKIYNIGNKTTENFDFDTYKETYSSYIGLTYEEAVEKISEEGNFD